MGPPRIHAPDILPMSENIKAFLKDAGERNEVMLATKSIRVSNTTQG
jgi:hypothetical protein